MNRKIVITWIALIALGFICNDFVDNLIILSCLWTGIIILGSTVILKYGWKQNSYLCIYWILSIILITTLSAVQYITITNNSPLFPFNHISTITVIILGINFLITTFISRILYFGPLGLLLLISALPLDNIVMRIPGTTYGILFVTILMGYLALTYLTPNDRHNLGKHYLEANGLDEENLTQMHKFKCTNCSYIYEGYQKMNYCPRCMAGSDLFVDVG